RRQHDLRQRHHHRVPAGRRRHRPPAAAAGARPLPRAHAVAPCRRHHGCIDPGGLREPLPAGRLDALAALARAPARQDHAGTGSVRKGPSRPREDRHRRDRAVLRARLSRLAPRLSRARRLAERILRARAGFRTHARSRRLMPHTANTPADPPYWMAAPSNSRLKLPPGACDAHVHVFGPRARFPFAEGRRYTPSDAPKELLFKLHEKLGIQHCVIVQPACHGYDNAVTADAVAATGGAYRGVALVPVSISDAELGRLAAAGLCGARFHYMKHLGEGPSIEEAVKFARRLADIGWHLQIHMEAELIADLTPALRRSPVPVVVDHMGRVDASLGLEHPHFRALLALLADRNVWVKVSGADRITRKGPPYS